MEVDWNVIGFIICIAILALVIIGIIWVGAASIIESYKLNQVRRIKRQSQIPVVGKPYSYEFEPQLEFTVLSFDVDGIRVFGSLTIQIPKSDEIRSWDTTHDFSNLTIDVKHEDGSFETLVFNAEKSEPIGLDAWNTYVTKPVVIKQI